MAMQRQRIVILGSSKWPSISFNDSRTIAMIVYVRSPRLESFLFSDGSPLIVKRGLIKSIPDSEMVNLFMLMEKRHPLAATARHIDPDHDSLKAIYSLN